MPSSHKQILSVMEIDKQKGFTLTEIMITILIVGILAAIAVPTYESHVSKARCTDATTTSAA